MEKLQDSLKEAEEMKSAKTKELEDAHNKVETIKHIYEEKSGIAARRRQ